jgi:hypothetical protein
MVRIIRRTVNNFGIYNYLKFIRKLNMIARLLSQFRATKILEFKRVSKQNIENRQFYYYKVIFLKYKITYFLLPLFFLMKYSWFNYNQTYKIIRIDGRIRIVICYFAFQTSNQRIENYKKIKPKKGATS